MNIRCLILPALLLALSFNLSAENSISRQLADYIAEKDARIGVAAIIDGRDTVEVNGSKDFPMLSVYKFPQAIATARLCAEKSMAFTDTVEISTSELHDNTWSPLRDKYGQRDLRLPVAELLAYTMQQSDNNACDILFRLTGGPEAADSVMKSMGYHDINIATTEDDMHRDIYLCYLNHATPLEMARLLEQFDRELRDDSPEFMEIARLMETCATGTDRLAVPLTDAGVILGHKTGTGDINTRGRIIAINDAGYVRIDGQHRYSIAVFIADSAYDFATTSAMIADISEIVYRGVTK